MPKKVSFEPCTCADMHPEVVRVDDMQDLLVPICIQKLSGSMTCRTYLCRYASRNCWGRWHVMVTKAKTRVLLVPMCIQKLSGSITWRTYLYRCASRSCRGRWHAGLTCTDVHPEVVRVDNMKDLLVPMCIQKLSGSITWRTYLYRCASRSCQGR